MISHLDFNARSFEKDVQLIFVYFQSITLLSLEKIFLRCCMISHLDFNVRSFEKDIQWISVLLA